LQVPSPLPTPSSTFWIWPPNTMPEVPWVAVPVVPVPLIVRTVPGVPEVIVTAPNAPRATFSGVRIGCPKIVCSDSTCHAPSSSTCPATRRVP
jgi:hypothetical protein